MQNSLRFIAILVSLIDNCFTGVEISRERNERIYRTSLPKNQYINHISVRCHISLKKAINTTEIINIRGRDESQALGLPPDNFHQ